MPLTSSHFVAVSEGTLVTAAGNDWYKTAQWSGMANDGTTQSVAQVLAVACLAAPSCVGFHLISGGRLGEGALLYDSDSYNSTTWPPETPDAIAAAGGSSTGSTAPVGVAIPMTDTATAQAIVILATTDVVPITCLLTSSRR